MTTIIADPSKSVQGSAFYAEFVNESYGNVFQMFITPDGFNELGQAVPATLFSRTLTQTRTKRQWRRHSLSKSILADPGVETDASHRASRVAVLDSTIRRLTVQYKLAGEPIFVEVSKKDLTDVGLRKTPVKVTYRIGQTRTAKGYPEMFAK